MQLPWPGQSSLKSRLITLLLGCNTLLLLSLTLSFIYYQRPASSTVTTGSTLPHFASFQLTLALLGSVALAAFLSRRIDRIISEPIRDLSRKMEIVSRSQDYRVRVDRAGEDELAVLFACFNNMLAEISIRDERLALHSEELELEVAERTLELSEVNRQLEASLESVRDAMQSAQSANRAKSDFLAQMSHEIRTPMYGVLGMTELLLGTDLTKEQARYVDTVRRSGEALLSIINNILDFSKIEAGRMELERIPFDLHQLAADAIAVCAEDAARKGLELTLELEPGLPRMFVGDPGRLRQVVVNLLGNAVKFTLKGWVRLTLAASEPLGLVCFSVEDTGIGIAPEAQLRIFNQFTQGDESMTRKYGGTGLGLAIARQLTELMGGSLELASESGRGSRFSFTAQLEVHEEATRSERCCTALRDKRVLLATDDEETRAVIGDQLTSWGVDMECVGDAPDAFCRIVTAPFDLAVLDHRLAGTDGIELAATFRTVPAGRSVRILLLTERDEQCHSTRLAELEATTFPKRALRQDGLYRAVMAALGMDEEERRDAGCCGAPAPRQRQVLLVEDNTVNQEVGKGMLESLGCRVKVVEDGAAAVSEVQRTRYDVVFMDCQMPVMDGLEATRRIRLWEQGSGTRIPIIALTAYAMPGDRVACLEAGADDYLSKPFTCEQIAKAMERQLDGVATTMAAAHGEGEAEPAAVEPLEVISHDKMSGALEIIRTLPGNRGMEILRKVVDLYLASTPALLQTMREAESGGDAEKLKAAAHSFKSSSANLGALRLAGVCMELESLGRAGSTEGALPLLHQVEEEYRLVRDALRGGPLC
ncbi:response regulator [Geomonas agri]|uniref:response regulator n=1 Tax=Geomonas agri TaxID=2873702 RepID=UPI001CD7A8C8|nr:response regulator [Geomonas agri]